MLEKLQAVLNKAREGHKYTSDIDKHGVPDHWDIDLEGDCEDHALWVRQELKKLGMESDLVLCRTETGGGTEQAGLLVLLLQNSLQAVF